MLPRVSLGWSGGLPLAGSVWLRGPGRPRVADRKSRPATTRPAGAAADVEIKLLVVDDPAIAEAVEQLRGEWKARTRSTIAIRQAKAADLVDAEKPGEPFDAVIYPSALLGTLAERGWIAPLPAEYAANDELAWSDTFELVQIAATVWGPKPRAVSFGEALFVCYYRADLFERFKKHPPRNWAEYHELAAFFHDRKNLEDAAPAAEAAWSGTVEPLATSWGGRVLLARAASYARHLDNYSTLFQVASMEPLVDGPPFVQALEELVADARFGPSGAAELEPAAARKVAGRPGRHGARVSRACRRQAERVGPAEAGDRLRRAARVAEGVQHRRGAVGQARCRRQPARDALGRGGPLGLDRREQRLSRPGLSTVGLAVGQGVGHARGIGQPGDDLVSPLPGSRSAPWVDPLTDSQAAAEFATAVRDALSEQASLAVPRIPGQDRYMAALDEAVAAALAGSTTPEAALQEAAARWQSITAELGLDAQRKAYRNSLGLEP